MKQITTAITEIKSKVSMDEWRQRIIDCQSSGMSIKAWCRENGVATSSYYHYLRKIRESVLEGKSARIHWEAVISIFRWNPHRIRRNYGHSSRKCLPGTDNHSSVRTEIMLKEIASVSQVYLVTGYTDLRLGIDGLAAIVQGKLELDPYSRALFLFCGRRRNRIKLLLWEGDGFLLRYKRLDNGCFRWPRNESEAKLLTEQEVRWLFEGLELEQAVPSGADVQRPKRKRWTDRFSHVKWRTS